MKHVYPAALLASLLISPSTLSAQSQAGTPVAEAELRPHIEVLASDRFGGRRPGTEGETLTVHYIATQLAAAGFSSPEADQQSWYQPVPLIELVPRTSALMARLPSGATVSFDDDFVLRAPSGRVDLTGAEAVFVGHGVDANGRVIDGVRGKVAIMLASEREGSPVQGLRQRRDLLARAGAVAVLFVSDIAAPFAEVRRSYSSGNIQPGEPLRLLMADGLLNRENGMRLLAAGGINAEQVAAVASGAPAALPLRLSLDIRGESSAHAYNSYNVVARLPGRRHESGSVLLTGHWDHLGLCQPEGARDRICNGAVDNASGIAVLIETARRLASGPRMDRDVWIIATTAEETGLLGAYWFVANPPVPLNSIHAVLNVDTVAIAPRGAPVAIVGRGTTDLDDDVAAVAAMVGRPMVNDDAANAFIRRQDGWAFTQARVPAIMAGGSFADPALLQEFLSGPYHKPNDELTAAVPLGGAAEDADLHIALTRRLADIRLSPPRTSP